MSHVDGGANEREKGKRAHSMGGVWRRQRIWLLVVVAYLWSFPFFPKLNNPNENVRVYMTRALVEHHSLDITRVEAEWGWVNDKAKSGTRLYSSKAPGVSYLGVPVLAAQTWLWHRLGWPSPSLFAAIFPLRVCTVILPLLAFFWFLQRYLIRVAQSRPVGELLFVGIALGSLVFPYGIQVVGHSLAAAASFGAFMVLSPDGKITSSARRAAVAGLCAGLGVLLEYQNILVAVLLTVYLLARRPRLTVAFIAGAVPAAVALGVFHTLCFGHPWDFPYGHLENLGFQATDHGRGFYGSSLPSASAFLSVWFLPGFGLLACSPFLLVALVAVVVALARGPRAEGALIAAVALALSLFLAGLPNWRGGWSVGPRYITVIVPFLVLALAHVWPILVARWSSTSSPWGILGGLIAVAVFLNGSWAVVSPQTPPQVRNPVIQIVWRLLGDGFAPYSVGYLLGMRGPLALVPVALAAVAAVALPLSSMPTRSQGEPAVGSPASAEWRGPHSSIRWSTRWFSRLRAFPVAIAVVLLFLIPLSLWPRRPSPGEREALRVIQATWAPLPARGPR